MPDRWLQQCSLILYHKHTHRRPNSILFHALVSIPPGTTSLVLQSSLPIYYALFPHYHILILLASTLTVLQYRWYITLQSMNLHNFSVLLLHTLIYLHFKSAEKPQQEIQWLSNFISTPPKNFYYTVQLKMLATHTSVMAVPPPLWRILHCLVL